MRINRLNVFPSPGGRFGIDEGFPGPPRATGDPKSATLFMSSPEFVKFMSQRKNTPKDLLHSKLAVKLIIIYHLKYDMTV